MTAAAQPQRVKARLLRCRGHWERKARAQGYLRVAGLDEAGRGCLFGPVCAVAVILCPDRPVRGLRDSKQLSAERREVLAARIRQRAEAWAVAWAEAEEIDRVNIYQASRLAMERAASALSPPPDFLLIDALTLGLPIAQRAIVHGDALCYSIAAASILAKVERDALMNKLDATYPGYGLARHKGYGTPEHLRALRTFGPTPHHRYTFDPVRIVHTQLPLFEEAEEVPCS